MNYIPDERDLQLIERQLNKLEKVIEKGCDRAFAELTEDIRRRMPEDSGEMKSMTEIRRADDADLLADAFDHLTGDRLHQWLMTSDAPHEGWGAEFGVDSRDYPPKKVFQKALDHFDNADDLRRWLDEEIDEVLKGNIFR